MGRKFNEIFIKCPFFESSFTKSITCEGMFEGSLIRHIYADSGKMNLHRLNCCENRYEECVIYQMLLKKYEE